MRVKDNEKKGDNRKQHIGTATPFPQVCALHERYRLTSLDWPESGMDG